VPEAKEEQVTILAEGVSGQWPVDRFVDNLKHGQVLFYPESDASWAQLVDLSLFEGFSPGMTGEQAVQALGPADEYREDKGDRYWIYHRSAAQVVVAHKSMGSLFGGRWWRLEAHFEPPAAPAKVFHASVVQAIPRVKLTFSVMIMNRNGSPAITAQIEDGKVVSMDWINNPGSRRSDIESRTSEVN
jgi:hypothetical protein